MDTEKFIERKNSVLIEVFPNSACGWFYTKVKDFNM